MTGSRILQLACLVGFTALSSNAQRSDVKSVVSLTPAIVEAGSPELIVISTQHAKSISGEWLGHKVQFFQRGDKWIALAGVDVEGAVGPSTLRINAELDRGGARSEPDNRDPSGALSHGKAHRATEVCRAGT